MSAYEDALKRVFFDYPDDPEFLQMVVDAFLAALPPSIVVDGRVVELEEVKAHLGVAYKVVELSHGVDVVPWLLDAAREVAE